MIYSALYDVRCVCCMMRSVLYDMCVCCMMCCTTCGVVCYMICSVLYDMMYGVCVCAMCTVMYGVVLTPALPCPPSVLHTSTSNSCALPLGDLVWCNKIEGGLLAQALLAFLFPSPCLPLPAPLPPDHFWISQVLMGTSDLRLATQLTVATLPHDDANAQHILPAMHTRRDVHMHITRAHAHWHSTPEHSHAHGR